nr:glycosyltransferase family 4 protein [Roseitranquillus sediminis]
MTHTSRPATFAIPGDIDTKTGGFIYERRLLLGLRAQRREVAHLQLPGGFPDPTPAEMQAAAAALAAVPAEVPLIVDGLVWGAIETEALAAARAPLVAMIHHPLALESGLSPARAATLHTREAANCALAAHVLVPSAHTARVLVADYGVAPDRITIAPPGFPKPESTRRPADPPLILSVGILHPRKGHDTLLDALAKLTDLRWQAVIAGPAYDTAHAALLRRQCDALGLSSHIRFAGAVDEPELHRLYSSATLFALATRYEGYGMVFSEALCHGLPIVACATGAVPDTVPADAGLLVPPDDPAAFAGALRRVLTDPALAHRLSEAAARAGDALPDWTDTAAIAGRVLDSLPG